MHERARGRRRAGRRHSSAGARRCRVGGFEDTPTAILVRQVLGAIAQFDKATRRLVTGSANAQASAAVAGRTWRRGPRWSPWRGSCGGSARRAASARAFGSAAPFVHRQEKLASHAVHLSLVVPALCSIGHADCLYELLQSALPRSRCVVRTPAYRRRRDRLLRREQYSTIRT